MKNEENIIVKNSIENIHFSIIHFIELRVFIMNIFKLIKR